VGKRKRGGIDKNKTKTELIADVAVEAHRAWRTGAASRTSAGVNLEGPPPLERRRSDAAAAVTAAPAAVVGDVTDGRRSGPVIAGFSMSSDLGIIVGPLAAGALVDATGSFAFAFATGAAISAVTLALCATMPETLRKASQTPPSPAAREISDQS
jgi:MFS family permease